MTAFNAYDEYTQIVVERFVQPLAEYGINCTESAAWLLAFIFRAEVAEYGQEGEDRISRTLELPIPGIAQYYRERYGEKDIDVNRLLHLVTEIGLFMRFPWGITRPPDRPRSQNPNA